MKFLQIVASSIFITLKTSLWQTTCKTRVAGWVSKTSKNLVIRINPATRVHRGLTWASLENLIPRDQTWVIRASRVNKVGKGVNLASKVVSPVSKEEVLRKGKIQVGRIRTKTSPATRTLTVMIREDLQDLHQTNLRTPAWTGATAECDCAIKF